MKVFVTGGSGFLGKRLIKSLCKEGHLVLALARSDESAKTVEDLGARAVMGDLSSPQKLCTGMEGCDVVFHVAAKLEITGSPEEFFEVNVQGTRNVLLAAKRARVPKFVHVSSATVLIGKKPIIRADETLVNTDMPVGGYAHTKAMVESEVIQANSEELQTIIVRPPLIWGVGDPKFLPELSKAVQRKQFWWIDRGLYEYSTCHVQNACEGIILAGQQGKGGEIYFVSDGTPIIFRDFITKILATQKLTPPTRSLPKSIAWLFAAALETVWSFLHLRESPMLTRTTIKLIGEELTVSDQKARSQLGYRGLVSYEQGLCELTV